MTNKRIIRVLIVISALFLALLTYLLYFNMFYADRVVTNPYNRRQWDEEKYVTRGMIYDADGLVLAETTSGENGQAVRRYSQDNLYSHIIGYCSQVYGKSLLERNFDKELLGKGDIDLFLGDKKRGFDLNLTVKNSLQELAYSQMDGRYGALVALEPKTGKVLAMVSLPDINPHSTSLEKSWTSIVEDKSSPLVARSTQGLYPPGSTFKIVTLAAAYEKGLQGTVFEDVGSFKAGNVTVENYNGKKYGSITLEQGFAVSSNQVFCSIGYDMGAKSVNEMAARFGIGENIEFDIDVAPGRIEYKKMTDTDGALVSIGQGQLLTTPLHMALICSTIANDGNMMRPYVVDSVTKNNITIKSTSPKVMRQVISPECADYVQQQMVEVVKNGTGASARIDNVTVAGKTGTAENEKEKAHSWFVGYAPAENPKIAVAVVLENDGKSGGDTAAPIASRVMEEYLNMTK